jgi:hypothetical protein
MPQVTPEEIVEFVRRRRKLKCVTRKGRKFDAEVNGDGLVFFLASGNRRSESSRTLTRVCEIFNREGSDITTHYRDVTWNASYTLAVIHEYLNQ